MSIRKTVDEIKSGQYRAVDLLDRYSSKIDRINSDVNSFITVFTDRAKKKAEAVDASIAKGLEPGPLAGIPISIKDNMQLAGSQTTCGSNILKEYISPFTATAVRKLEEAGALILGKTNMDEFAMGSSGETSYYGIIKNPAAPGRIPGGSSSGSAASVAAGQVMASLGSDTGGSIRQPAAMCGVVGLKPTYGLVSRYGLIAFASSLDQIGPLTVSVVDAASVLSVISGFDPKDSTSLDVDVPDYFKEIDKGVEGLKIGIPKEYLAEGLSNEIKGRIETTATALARCGAKIRNISLPRTKYAVAAYYIVAPA
ncbi:amidase, partial [Elusimicrobiota bacterium]